jgi:D-alanine-D-alanine ligase
MQLPIEQLQALQATCVSLFRDLNFQVYARIDGILATDGQIYLNDPNTTAGMNPSSFLFHQAAEIGFNPSQLLTFLIRNSLAKHVHTYQTSTRILELLHVVDTYIANKVRKG